VTDHILLDHIAFGVRSMVDAAEILVGRLGGVPHEGGPGLGFRGAQWRFEGMGRLEVIEPVGGPEGFLWRFIDARGPGIHHVTFIVPSLAEAAQRAREFAYDVVGYNDAFASWKEAFLHPRQAQGIVVQLAEKGEGGDDGWGRHFDFPRPPAPAAKPSRVVGLWMRAADAAGPRRQWADLLGATESVEGTRRIYRWSGAPLEIHVTVDDSGPPGPLGVIVEGASSQVLDHTWPALGARFVDAARLDD
jgi:methylmalonyl-CoA/ethylmalonyl-CoA epimerase